MLSETSRRIPKFLVVLLLVLRQTMAGNADDLRQASRLSPPLSERRRRAAVEAASQAREAPLGWLLRYWFLRCHAR